MSWILWAVFTFQSGVSVAYPLQPFPTEKECVNAIGPAVDAFQLVMPRLFYDVPKIKVVLTCSSNSKT